MPKYHRDILDDATMQLIEDVLNKEKQKKTYKIYFCIGNYPDIDPNEEHFYYDITSAHQEAIKVSVNQREIRDKDKVNEIIDRFGIVTKAYLKEFDYNKIKVEHCFKKKPLLIHKNSMYHTFSDGNIDAVIETSKIEEYMCKVPDEYIAYQRKYIAEIEDVTGELDFFLRTSFKAERDLDFNCVNTLLLSLEQIKVIEGMCKIELLKYYSEEEPNIFVVKSLSC